MSERIAYGEHPSQFGELWLPDAPDGPLPVVVLVHGGFWRERYGCDEMHALATDVAARGWAAWNLEYRRVGGDGGWPQTRLDVDSGIAHLATLAREHPLDTSRTAAVGHSAGGHLALLCGTACMAIVAQAAVSDPLDAYVRGLSGSAVADFLGGPPDLLGDVYKQASPLINVPLGVPQLFVHGDADEDVPVEQSRTYVAAARDARDDVEYVELAGAGHMEHTDPDSFAWRAAAEYLDRLFTPLRPGRG